MIDSVRVLKDGSHRITGVLVDSAGDGVIGLSPSIRIHDRVADEYLKNDASWSASPGTDYTMTETDATNLPGLYHYDFTLRGTATAYDVRTDGGSTPANRYAWGEIIAVDSDETELHLVKAMVANKREHTVSTGVDKVFDDDDTTLLRTMTPQDGGDDTIVVQPS